MKVIVDDKIPFIQGQIEQIADDVRYLRGAAITAADVRDADALIVRTRTRCDEALLAGSSVQLVVTATIGFDHIDTQWLERNGIRWTNCPGCNAASVRQYVHCSLLALGLLRKDLTVGVVGVGHVGTLVADDLEACGMRVLRCDPPRAEREGVDGFYTLEQLAEQCDIITFHTPCTTTGAYPTHHLADAAFFASLRRKPLIINAARGPVVDTQALLTAMDQGVVRDVVIDTWEGEPAINMDLLRRAVIATPHVAGYSADGKANATRMSLQALCRHFGLPFELNIQPPALPEGFCYGRSTDDPALRLYDPEADTARLKSAPDTFEQLRGDYPLRREF